MLPKLSALFVALMAIVLHAAPAHAQTADIEVLGQAGGTAFDMVLSGERAYVAVGPRVIVVDVSVPERMVRLGESTDYGVIVRRVALKGCVAYALLQDSGLRVIDACVPTLPLDVASVDVEGRALAVDGDLLYVGGGRSFHVFDIADSRSPRLVGSADAVGTVVDLVGRGGYAYVATDMSERSVMTFDVSEPARPKEKAVASVPINPGLSTFDPSLRYLGFSGQSELLAGSGDGTLTRLDLSDPASPSIVRSMAGGMRSGVAKVGGRVLLASRNQVTVLPDDPAETSSEAHALELGGYAAAIAPIDETRFLVLDSAIGPRLYELSEAERLPSLGRLDIAARAIDLEVRDGIAYVASTGRGLSVIDITSPRLLRFVGAVDFESARTIDERDVTDVAVVDETAYVAAGVLPGVADSGGVYGIDVADSRTPSWREPPVRAEGLNQATGVAFNGRALAALDVEGALHRFDVSPTGDLSAGLTMVFPAEPPTRESCGNVDLEGRDGRFLAAIGSLGTVVWTEALEGAPFLTLFDTALTCARAISFDGRHLAVLDRERVHLWDLPVDGPTTKLGEILTKGDDDVSSYVDMTLEGLRIFMLQVECCTTGILRQYVLDGITRPRLTAEWRFDVNAYLGLRSVGRVIVDADRIYVTNPERGVTVLRAHGSRPVPRSSAGRPEQVWLPWTIKSSP